MNAPLTPAILLSAVRATRQQRLAEDSLMEFVRQAWHVVEPGTPYIDGWHLHAIADHLEAVAAGEIRRLIITMPPRHAKSLMVAVFFPVWVWIARPEFRWMFASYATSLSVRDSLKCRRLVHSEWFQERWGKNFVVSSDQNAKLMFENNLGGYRFATSVGASTTGHGGDCVVVDDALNSADAQSDTIRKAALDWFDMSASTRLNNPKTGCFIIVQQRLHEKDLAGHLLAQDGWDHLDLPAEYDGLRAAKTTLNWKDPRSKIGSLLWPERFGRAEIDFLKKQLGEYGTSGQLQQRPSPPGGGILKVEHFKRWPKDDALPAFDQVIQSYDTAFTKETQNDPCACTVWGLFKFKKMRCALLLDAWDEHLEYPQLREKVLEDWHSVYGRREGKKGRKADHILIEKKASGQSLIQDLRQGNVPAQFYVPEVDKIARAHQAAPMLELDVFYIMESNKEPGTHIKWARPFVDQLSKFPNDEHDDLTDTFTQFVIFSRDMGWLELERAEDDVIEELPYTSKKKVNPYAK